MKRNSKDEDAIRVIGQIIRATRKQLGLSQQEFSRKLGLMQSALSRIETGFQNLTAAQWLDVCQITGISLESIRYGYIEHHQPLDLQQGGKIGSFRLPSRYARNRGTKVRAALPILTFFKKEFGEKKLASYLDTVQVDPDYLVNLDNQINIGFSIDMCRTLIEKGRLKPTHVAALTRPVRNPEVHGRLRHEYDTRESGGELIVSLLRNIRQYECNFEYSLEDKSRRHLDVTAAAHSHVEEVVPRDDAMLGDFLCRYRKSYLGDFSTYGGRPRQDVEELECYYKGQPKCVYRIALAV